MNFTTLSAFTVSLAGPDWNDHEKICHSLILETIDYFDRNPNLPVDRKIYLMIDKLRWGGFGLDKDLGAGWHNLKCATLQDMISEASPYILVVKDLYCKDANDMLRASLQVRVKEELIFLCADAKPVTVSPSLSKTVLIISEKAMKILNAFTIKMDQAAEKQKLIDKEVNENMIRYGYTKQIIIGDDNDQKCCIII